MYVSRGWVQWHSIAIVIAELGGNKNQHFVNTAWAVLDPILSDWDKVYRAKKDEPAWVHVNALIGRARQLRRQVPDAPVKTSDDSQNPSISNDLQDLTPQQPYPNSLPQYAQSSIMGVLPDATWQSWSPSNSSGTIVPRYEHSGQPTPTLQQFQAFPTPTAANVDVPFQTGCAPTMYGFDGADFGYIEGLDNIDFSAFDAVFKDVAWDFSSPSTDQGFEHLGTYPVS